METCWLVKCPKGDAVFLAENEQRALDYAAHNGGILIQMWEPAHLKGKVRAQLAQTTMSVYATREECKAARDALERLLDG